MSPGTQNPSFLNKFNRLRDFSLSSLDSYTKVLFGGTELEAAARYSVLSGGKCVRAVLALGAGELLGIPLAQQEAFAVAVELIHSSTLVHDDLPAMDDDDMRRGQPSCHKKFDEPTAILVGDLLFAAAFEVLAASELVDPEVRNRQAVLLAQATAAVCNGQLLDLQASGKVANFAAKMATAEEELTGRHDRKTAALIRASVLSAVQFLPSDDARDPTALLSQYGTHLGLLFQITDDLLEVTSSTEELGKDVGSDARQGTPTYVSVFGLPQAQSLAQQTAEKAEAALVPFGASADFLRWMIGFVLDRRK